jgi:aspartate/methionine/tyrosine aminotransferase
MAGFSDRTAWDRRESALAQALRAARQAGQELIDLTMSNPTVCGFGYAEAEILGALTDRAALVYDPDPRGIRSAREAVADYYRGHRAAVDPDDIVLTTSTSEAYSYLLRLLCNSGDEVLAALPSYPLFDYLAELQDIRLHSYPLFYDFGWWIDFAELERRITPRTRAILLVHPNNPTGHVTGAVERTQLEELCLRHGLALVVDEVFLDYGLEAPVESFARGPHPVLTFVVSGLSKICGLPQMKAAWLAAFGPERQEAMQRLEIVADTFLSMNAPVQHALPVWLVGREAIQRQILDRVRGNLAIARASGSEVLRVEAGWSAILRLPDFAGSGLATELISRRGVVVHPGSFYGIGERNRVVLSLLGPVREFERGIEKLMFWCEPT